MYPYYQYPIYQKPSLLYNVKTSINRMDIQKTIELTHKTIYTANQIIPIIIQLKPIIRNASQAFKIAKTMKEFDFDDIDIQ